MLPEIRLPAPTVVPPMTFVEAVDDQPAYRAVSGLEDEPVRDPRVLAVQFNQRRAAEARLGGAVDGHRVGDRRQG
jgi:hypothetical protein